VSLIIDESIPLAPLTTLGLGGSARFCAEIRDASDVAPAIAWARQKEVPVFALGGGSNLVVADEGFAGLVLRMRTGGRRWSEDGAEMRVEVEAGESWDDVVAEAVARGAAGIECLSGIPGSAGAAPVQNIGAYGQEVASAIRRVRVLDRQSLEVRELDCDACGFGYRDSSFKREPDRFVILSVTLGLSRIAPPTPRYPELATSLVAKPRPSLTDIREAVLTLRRKKSMVLDEADPNHRSAGSFFTNPIVTAEIAAEVAARAGEGMPRYPLPDGRVKLAAGWLIERGGLGKGFRMGPVGISSRHALALVHHEGGTTKDLLRLAQHVHQAVLDRFGISLAPEPVFLGLAWPCTSVPLGAL
jgi:UDP-N-acetylmuramate dehydrogenase